MRCTGSRSLTTTMRWTTLSALKKLHAAFMSLYLYSSLFSLLLFFVSFNNRVILIYYCHLDVVIGPCVLCSSGCKYYSTVGMFFQCFNLIKKKICQSDSLISLHYRDTEATWRKIKENCYYVNIIPGIAFLKT